MTAPLGSNVTLECVTNELAVGWKINGLQLLEEARIQDFKDEGLILGVGGPEIVNGGNRITITIPATVHTSDAISTIVCQAGPDKFQLEDGETITFTVYGRCLDSVRGVLGKRGCRVVVMGELVMWWSQRLYFTGFKGRKYDIINMGPQHSHCVWCSPTYMQFSFPLIVLPTVSSYSTSALVLGVSPVEMPAMLHTSMHQ